MRAKYVTIMFKKSLQSFTSSLPLVTDCGWKIEDWILVIIMTDMLPGPEVANVRSPALIRDVRALKMA